MANLKVIAACGNGMGTSMIIKLKVQKILKELNIPADVDMLYQWVNLKEWQIQLILLFLPNI